MLPLPDLEVYAGLVALLAICLPLGAALVRAAEKFLGRTVALSPVERLLFSFYATGGLLFVLASIPVALYGLASVAGLLIAGAVAYATLAVRERGRGVRAMARFLVTPQGLLLALGSLGLLAVEVVGGSLVLPNGIDGAVDSLFVNQLLGLHTVAWTLQPYANAGVTYPQGSTVWFSLPVLLLGWPIVAAPVELPPLFLSLSPAAAFCLGERLDSRARSTVPWTGVLFAGFFGLLASWPRLYVGGSYDFILALPLFVVLLGFVRPVVSGTLSWREAVVFGVVLGTGAAVSFTVTTALCLLLLGHWLWTVLRGRPQVLRRLAGMLVSVGVTALFTVRSLVGIAYWWSYPGHVLTPNSVPPFSPLVNQATYGDLLAEVDPFQLWKWKVSPFPVLTLELQFLLVVGLVLAVIVAADRRSPLREFLPRELSKWALAGTAVLFLTTVAVGLLGAWNTSVSGIQSVTNLWELSILLFLFYSLIALLPLVAAANYLRTRPRAPKPSSVHDTPTREPPRHARGLSLTRPRTTALVVALLVIPLASGAAVTSTVMSTYLHQYLLGQSNGTTDDVLALEWAGDHLPRCSGVLAAPGSAAQFLPEYATIRMIYPAYPTPSNLTYYNVVQDLTNGRYGPVTRAGLLSLQVTEVFVTGPTTDTYGPFAVAPLEHSSDFSLLFYSGDALIFEFLPGAAALNCPPN